MRVVRCDSCGSKAMLAAGQCPKCSHLFELRDGFGEMLPLAYCSSCESYYPESVGQCKWCGTKPERPPIWPQVLRGAIAVGAVAIVGTAWMLNDRSPRDTQSLKRAAVAKSMPAPRVDTVPPPAAADVPVVSPPAQPAATSNGVVTVRDTTQAPSVVSVRDTSPIELPMVPSREIAAVRDTAPVETATPATRGIAAKPPAARPRGSTPSTTRRSVRWVRSVSRDWVVVRARASKESRIVASIGPRSRVELGETVGSWRRIRAKGFAGWVEPRNSFYAVGAR